VWQQGIAGACLHKRPPEAGSTPVRQLMVVVLPAPLGPNKQNSWPRGMRNQGPLSAQNTRASSRFRFPHHRHGFSRLLGARESDTCK
jgi:hypothetical protein